MKIKCITKDKTYDNTKDKIKEKVLLFCMIFLIFLILSVILSSCALTPEGDFPVVSFPKEDMDNTDDEVPDELKSLRNGKIKVALPLAQNDLDYLLRMYVGEKEGLFTAKFSRLNGENVPLETLNEYKSGLNVEKIDIGKYGYSIEQIISMKNSKTLPDIYLTQGYQYPYSNNLVASGITMADLSGKYLDKYLIGGKIYPNMIYSDPETGSVRGLPFYASMHLLYANMNVMQALQIDTSIFDSPLTFDNFLSINSEIMKEKKNLLKKISDTSDNSNEINQTFTDKERVESIFGFKGIRSFLSSFPGSVSPFPNRYLILNGEQNIRNPGMEYTLELIKKFMLLESTYEFYVMSSNGENGIIDDDCLKELDYIAFWTADSSFTMSDELGNINIRILPLPVVDRVNLPLEVYPVVVNPDASLIRESIEFATYITLDEDALLFRSRFAKAEGFIPPIISNYVWEAFVRPQKHGEEMMRIKEYATSFNTVEPAIYEEAVDNYNRIYDDYIYDIIFNNMKFD